MKGRKTPALSKWNTRIVCNASLAMVMLRRAEQSKNNEYSQQRQKVGIILHTAHYLLFITNSSTPFKLPLLNERSFIALWFSKRNRLTFFSSSATLRSADSAASASFSSASSSSRSDRRLLRSRSRLDVGMRLSELDPMEMEASRDGVTSVVTALRQLSSMMSVSSWL